MLELNVFLGGVGGRGEVLMKNNPVYLSFESQNLKEEVSNDNVT